MKPKVLKGGRILLRKNMEHGHCFKLYVRRSKLSFITTILLPYIGKEERQECDTENKRMRRDDCHGKERSEY